MQDIYTGNGEGEADHGEVAQRLAPVGHFCQEGGWRESVGKWYYPSPGARATHPVEHGGLSDGNRGHGGDAT